MEAAPRWLDHSQDSHPHLSEMVERSRGAEPHRTLPCGNVETWGLLRKRPPGLEHAALWHTDPTGDSVHSSAPGTCSAPGLWT